jgi:hypothetical protein
VKEGDCRGGWELQSSPGTSEETIPEGQAGANCESLRMKMIGKPYSGKPNVRFDEGELEIEPLATTPALYSTGRCIFFLSHPAIRRLFSLSIRID